MKPIGKVYLVGAGPGSADLLTIKAARLIAQADDLVVDALVPAEVYATSPARRIYVGKRAGTRCIEQRDIEKILMELALAGRRVVRLKGGDGGIFGRLAEEIAALEDANVPWEVVPGVSSALATPAALGIAATARTVAEKLVIVSGHRRRDAMGGSVELPPYDPAQTVVVLMGLRVLAPLIDAALCAGYPADLPAGAVSHASLPHERHVLAPLQELPDAVLRTQLAAPCTIVLGEVVRSAMERTRTAKTDLPTKFASGRP